MLCHAQIQYKPMESGQCGFYQLLQENGLAGLEIGLLWHAGGPWWRMASASVGNVLKRQV
jgi:hypothetical protein